MLVATGIQFVIRIAHCFGPATAEHNLEVNRLKAVVIVAVNHASRTGDAFPRSQTLRYLATVLVLDEHVEMALEHEENFLDLMRMRCISLTGRNEHDGERKIAWRN